MTARPYIKWLESDAKQTRCAIGRHTVELGPNLRFLIVDGKMVCYKHVTEIVDAYNDLTTPKQRSESEIIKGHRERERQFAKQKVVMEMRKQSERAPGFVYYIRIEQHIKIGYATDIAKRMRAYPPSAVLLAAHPGTKATERQMHLEYRRYLDRGREWFRQGEKLMTHIAGVVEKFGDPKVLAYEYTKAKHAV